MKKYTFERAGVFLAYWRSDSRRWKRPGDVSHNVPVKTGTKTVPFEPAEPFELELDYTEDGQCSYVSATWNGERPTGQTVCEAVPMPVRSDLPVRCEGYAELCLWLLWRDGARELMADIPTHDREDIRQELTLRNWQYAVQCESQGKRLPNPERWMMKELRRIISRRSGMQTIGYATDDAAKAAKALRDDARAAEREAAYLQHMRAEAAKQAEQVKPVPVLSVRW